MATPHQQGNIMEVLGGVCVCVCVCVCGRGGVCVCGRGWGGVSVQVQNLTYRLKFKWIAFC